MKTRSTQRTRGRTAYGGAITALLPALLIAFCNCITMHAQAPAVDWKRTDWLPFIPGTNTPITQNGSGEDWWYDHLTSVGQSGIDGILCAGYSTVPNWWLSETSLGGCLESVAGDPECTDFETPGNQKGSIMSTLAMVNTNGSGYQWYNSYLEGFFNRVIQTSDGGFLAIGATANTRVSTTSAPIYYNPGESPGDVTDQFDLGVACAAGTYVRHIVLVKIDHAGAVQWQYIYGMTPYRQGNTLQPDRAYAALGEGWDVVELPTGEFAMTGYAMDPPNGITREFLIKVDAGGQWLWGSFYGPNDKGSTGKAITTYGTGPGLKLVVSGHELFTGSVASPFLSNGLFQKAFLKQYDASGSGAPTTHEWAIDNVDPDYTASQSTHDVQIQVNGNNDILWPIITHCENCLYAGFNSGQGKVYRVNTSGGILGSTDFGTVTAYDLKMRVLALADGGFGVVSSKQPQCPPAPYVCDADDYYDTRYWYTDAYAAHCNACGALIWQSTYDVDNNPPAANYPGNVKRQECMYGISLAGDGGFILSGNNSFNFDDDYLIKLQPDQSVVEGLYMQDTPLDFGLEPNPDNGPMWISNDIWVRNDQDDAQRSHAHQHQNPEYRDPALEPPNYIYVHVRNRGCAAATGTLKIYAAPASTGLAWPTDWTTAHYVGSEICLGELTSVIAPITVNVPAGGDEIVELAWYPPDPAAYGSHICLLARVEPLTGLTEGTFEYTNVKENNKIVWKNVTVVNNLEPFNPDDNWVGIRNISDQQEHLTFKFTRPTNVFEDNIYTYFTVTVYLEKDVGAAWKAGGNQSKDVVKVNETTIQPTTESASISDVILPAGASHDIHVKFTPKDVENTSGREYFTFDLVQYQQVRGAADRVIGGERYLVRFERPPGGHPASKDPGTTGAAASAAPPVLSCLPNPTSGETEIHATLTAADRVRMELIDERGRVVRRLLDEQREAGAFTVHVDTRGLPSGAYVVRMETSRATETTRMILKR